MSYPDPRYYDSDYERGWRAGFSTGLGIAAFVAIVVAVARLYA